MLTNDAINSALPLVDVLEANNLSLHPIEGSPLDKLVKATHADEDLIWQINTKRSMPAGVTENPTAIDVKNIIFMANNKDPASQCSAHDMEMDQQTVFLTKAVQGHINFAKTVVKPAVMDLVERVKNRLLSLSPSALLGMEVICWNPPVPLLNPALEKAVRQYEDTPFDRVKLNSKCPNLAFTDIVELLKTGSRNLDGDIEAWVAEKGEFFFLNIWSVVFQTRYYGLKERNVDETLESFTECKKEGLDKALAIFLLSRKLFDNPLEGTEMPINVYNRLMCVFRDQSAARLCRGIAQINQINKSQTLIKSVDGPKIVVHGSVYNKWIQDGGENEVLFGNILTVPYAAAVSAINAKATDFKAKWAKHAALKATVESNNRYNRTIGIIREEFDKQLRNVVEGDEGTQAGRTLILKLFDEEIQRIRLDDLNDLWNVCLKVVCRSRFYRTDAEKILATIERVAIDNPGIDVAEAAAISAIEYIADWVAEMLKVN